MRQHASGIFEHHLQQLILCRRQLDFVPFYYDPVLQQIELQAAAGQQRFSLFIAGSAQADPHPGHQLTHTKRFGHIIIGAGV